MKKVWSALDNENLGVCSVAWKTNKGDIGNTTSAICFAPMFNQFIGVDRSIGLSQLYMGVQQPFTEDEEYYIPKKHHRMFEKYMLFVMTESIFKDAFITKRVCDAKRYGIEMNTKVAGNIVLSAMICIRRGWEMVDRMYAWNFLVKNGVCPHISLILSHFMGYNPDRKSLYALSNGMRKKNHEVFEFESIAKGLSAIKYGAKPIEKPYCESINHGWVVFRTTNQYEVPLKLQRYPMGSLFHYKDNFSEWSCNQVYIKSTISNILHLQKEFYA